jgi:hypothetical protein
MTEPRTKEIKSRLKDLSLTNKVLAPIAVLVVVGWLFTWVTGGTAALELFSSWFQTLSFFGALVVAVLVGLRLFSRQIFPEEMDRRMVAIASLLPVFGYLLEIITSLQTFLTIGGAIAMAYIAATTHWRNHIPQFVTSPLGDAEAAQAVSRQPGLSTDESIAPVTSEARERIERQREGRGRDLEKSIHQPAAQ